MSLENENSQPETASEIATLRARVAQLERENSPDATEQINLKIEAAAALARGIAHDFNNILSSMVLNVEMMDILLPQDHAARENLDLIAEASARATDVIRRIQTFICQQDMLEKSPARVGPIVRETLNSLRASLPSNITIREEIKAKQETVLASPKQIRQALENLCANALRAMEKEGGTLTVGLDNLRLDRDSARLYPGIEPGPILRLTVSDTGCGISPDITKKIFDPFFSTKVSNGCVGLGLSIVYQIAQSHSGCVVVQSEPGQGAAFAILLPLLADQEIDKKREVDAIPMARKNERILLVDDDKNVLFVTNSILMNLGYRVISHADSQEAWLAFKENPDGFNLVITDQVMAHLTGVELAKNILSIRRDMPIIFVSGFVKKTVMDDIKALGIREFLKKPFDQRALACAIQRALPSSASDEEKHG